MVIFVVWIAAIRLEKNINFSPMKKYVKIICNIIMPSEDTKILELNQYKKSDKVPFIIYSVLQCLIEKIGWCKNNPEN